MRQLDKEGYPTKEILKYIEKYDVSKQSVRFLIELIQSIWWASEWGFEITEKRDNFKSVENIKDKPRYHSRKRIYISTGGWSGNEDIIRALKLNKWFYCFYWVQSRRGGHYVFEIPLNSWNKQEKK